MRTHFCGRTAEKARMCSHFYLAAEGDVEDARPNATFFHRKCFGDGAALLEAARSAPPFDVAFLDIYIPGESGLEVAKALRVRSPQTGLVFVTSSRDHAVTAFSLDALHYLVKPVRARDVAEVFRRLEALDRQQIRSRASR